MLPSPQDDIRRRRWIWQAVSDLFLDEEPNESVLCHIAYVAAHCGYTEDELDIIYAREVAPAVAFNAFSTAGIWGYFDTEWLEERILHTGQFSYWFHRLIIAPIPLLLLSAVWRRVKNQLPTQRNRVRMEQEEQKENWKPMWSEDAPSYRWG